MNPTPRAAAIRRPGILCCAMAMLLVMAARGYAQATPEAPAEQFQQIQWKVGPASVPLGSFATLSLPKGFRFTDGPGAAIWNRLNHNPPGDQLGILCPPEDSGQSWFISFSFQDVGYVKDDEKLDNATVDNLLDSIKTGTEQSNAERRRNGWETMSVVGWDQRPFYDPQTHHLTWAIRGRASSGGESVNYDSRVLGRHGVMRVKLVDAPESIAANVPTFNKVVTSIGFNQGENYSEYRAGDKIAQYGLVGLISGGAAVAAVKFWKPLMKLGAFIVAGIAAVVARIKRAFSRKKS